MSTCFFCCCGIVFSKWCCFVRYCGGGSVAEVIRVLNRPLSEDCIALVVRDCLTGLKYLHSKAIVHRDISEFDLFNYIYFFVHRNWLAHIGYE